MSDPFHSLRIQKGLNKPQLDLLKELVDDALAKAANSMERMLKIRIRSNFLDFALSSTGTRLI